jgi:hypothetical protein
MRTVALVLAGSAVATGSATAQVSGAVVKGGDVYVQLPDGLHRLTHDGQVAEATVSRDKNLVAYVRNGPKSDNDSLNDIFLCSVRQQSCVLAVRGVAGATTKDNLVDIGTVRFSLQAGENAGGILSGSIFFLSAAGGANTDSLHRVMLGGKTLQQVANSPVAFVTYANSIEVVPTGRFAGALNIEVQQYTPHGACGAMTVFDPNTKKILQQGPANDC